MKRVFVIVFLALRLWSAKAQPGAPDASFGTAGVVTTTFGSGHAVSKSMAIQADGKIVMAGYHIENSNAIRFALARYNNDGSPDFSFDTDGKVSTTIGTDDDEVNAIAIQADGKIIVAGRSHIAGSPERFAIARYNTDGSPDNTFSSDGKLVTQIGSANAIAYAIVIQRDGKIVVAGSWFNGINNDFAMARYNTDGTPDNSFGVDGIVITPVGNSHDAATSMVIQPDDKIVVAGSSGIAASSDLAIVRYNYLDGTLDNSFSGDGKLIIPSGGDAADNTGLALQTDGKIVLAGGNGNNFLVVRISPDGIPDNQFDNDGIVTTNFGATTSAEGTSVAIQGDGKIVVAGHAFTGIGWDFALARYNSNGSPDNTFDNDGKLTKNGNGNDFGYAMKLSGERIYVGGVSNQVVFSLLAFQTGSIVLPLRLTAFNIFKQPNGIELKWQTESEVNVSHFEIEKSINGISFSTIGQVQAIHNSAAVKKYDFIDTDALSGSYFYRLKMVDADGRFTFSKVLIIRVTKKNELDISPNPARDILNVQVDALPGVELIFQIVSVTGEVMMRQSVESNGRRLSTTMNISGLAKGLYFIRVTQGGNMSVKQFIKQ